MEKRAFFLIYCSSALYNFALSMVIMLIPLYAYDLNFSPFVVGVIIAIQGILQLFLRVFSGVLCDRFGEVRVLALSYGFMLLTTLFFTVSGSLWMLVVNQFILGISRSLYWTASQTYASRINETKATSVLGKLTGYVNIGMILGYVLAGVALDVLGFKLAFGLSLLLSTIAFLLAFIMPGWDRRNTSQSGSARFLPMYRMLRVKVLFIAGILAFVAAYPISLLGSFYPIYFSTIGFSKSVVGVFSSLLSVGTILIGFLFAFLSSRIDQKWLFALSVGGTGLFVGMTPYVHGMGTLMILLLLVGVASGIGTVLYQSIVTKYFPANQRGVALGVAGIFWALSQMTIPPLFGLATSLVGFEMAFVYGGACLIFGSFLTPLIFKTWLVVDKGQS